MTVRLNNKGLMYTEEDFKTFAENKQEMYDTLEDMKRSWEKKNAVELPEIKTYDKKEYIDSDPNTIKAQAEEEYKGAREAGIADIKSSSSEKKSKVQAKIEKEKQDYLADTERIKSNAEQRKKESLSEAINKGIARSSILASESDRIDSETEMELSERLRDSTVLNNVYNMELTVLEERLNSALEAFEIENAVKIKKRINDLTKDIEDENEKILEYNNKMTELEQKSIRARAEAEEKNRKMAEAVSENERIYGYSGAKKEHYDSRMTVAKRYYMSLPKEQALKEFDQDEKMHEYLGLNYTKLRTLLNAR